MLKGFKNYVIALRLKYFLNSFRSYIVQWFRDWICMISNTKQVGSFMPTLSGTRRWAHHKNSQHVQERKLTGCRQRRPEWIKENNELDLTKLTIRWKLLPEGNNFRNTLIWTASTIKSSLVFGFWPPGQFIPNSFSTFSLDYW